MCGMFGYHDLQVGFQFEGVSLDIFYWRVLKDDKEEVLSQRAAWRCWRIEEECICFRRRGSM